MKKIFAILFLSIHLFNICGYRLFFSVAENAADKQMVATLDESNFKNIDLIELKLPLNIPYSIDRKGYERCDGQIELNGIHYNYVKRTVRNDTMYLYCIPNEQKTQLCNVKTEYAKQAADNAPGKKSEQSAAKKTGFQNEYNSGLPSYNFALFKNLFAQSLSYNNCIILKGFTQQPAQPPDLFI